MGDSGKYMGIGEMYWMDNGGESVVENKVYETTPYIQYGVSVRQCIYMVRVIRRLGDIPRFEIIDYVPEKDDIITFSAPLKEMIFSTNDRIDRDSQMIVACGRRAKTGYPLRFYSSPEFYVFLLDCKNGFADTFNKLISTKSAE